MCPAGHEAVSEYEDEDAPERVEMHFAREVCEPCSLRSRCPVRWRRRSELGGEWSPRGAYVLSAAESWRAGDVEPTGPPGSPYGVRGRSTRAGRRRPPGPRFPQVTASPRLAAPVSWS